METRNLFTAAILKLMGNGCKVTENGDGFVQFDFADSEKMKTDLMDFRNGTIDKPPQPVSVFLEMERLKLFFKK